MIVTCLQCGLDGVTGTDQKLISYHVCAVDGSDHLYLPEVLAVAHGCGASHGRRTIAEVRVEDHCALVILDLRRSRLVLCIPRPLASCNKYA